MDKLQIYEKLIHKLNSLNFHLSKYKFVEASPWINLVRAHPELLKEYSFFSYNNKSNNLKQKKSFIYFLRKALNELFSTTKFKYSNKVDKIDFLIISSHAFESKNLTSDNDFYFDNLQKYLENNNLNSLLALRNINNTNIKEFQKIKSFKNSSKVLMPIRNTLFKEIYYLANLIFTKIILNFIKIKNKKTQLILNEFNKIKILLRSIKPLRNYDQFVYLLKKHRPKYVITTFEGHSWEFLLFKAIKVVDPNIKIFAYQHSVILQNQNTIFNLKIRKYLPDFVLTSGSINKHYLKNKYKFNKIKVEIIGNNVGLNKKFSKKKLSKFKHNNCLVIPEGIESETKIIVDFISKYSELYDNTNFIIKSHPIFNKNYYANYYKLTKYKNISIIENLSENVIQQSKYFLYRGSSLAINLVTCGMIPIYLEDPDNIDINPFYFCMKDSLKISNIKDLKNIFDTNNQADDVIVSNAFDYFHPLDYNSLMRLI